MKIVINVCFGGFSISKEAAEFMAARGNEQAAEELAEYEKSNRWYGYGYTDSFDEKYSRTDNDLVAAVETLGHAANGSYAQLKVVKVPDGVAWEIAEYDGMEHIAEVHRTWR